MSPEVKKMLNIIDLEKTAFAISEIESIMKEIRGCKSCLDVLENRLSLLKDAYVVHERASVE